MKHAFCRTGIADREGRSLGKWWGWAADLRRLKSAEREWI